MVSHRRRESFEFAKTVSDISVIGLFFLAVMGCQTGAGVNKISQPSSSARAAKSLRVYLQPATIIIHTRGNKADGIRYEEAWLEEVVERFESWPIKRRAVGVRLCLRFSDAEKSDVDPHWWADVTHDIATSTNPAPSPGTQVMSGDSVVFSFDVNASAFPSKGQITINDRTSNEEIFDMEFNIAKTSDDENTTN